MLSAVVINTDGRPGAGFYDAAVKFGRAPANADEAFWNQERAAVHDAWKRPCPNPPLVSGCRRDDRIEGVVQVCTVRGHTAGQLPPVAQGERDLATGAPGLSFSPACSRPDRRGSGRLPAKVVASGTPPPRRTVRPPHEGSPAMRRYLWIVCALPVILVGAGCEGGEPRPITDGWLCTASTDAALLSDLLLVTLLATGELAGTTSVYVDGAAGAQLRASRIAQAKERLAIIEGILAEVPREQRVAWQGVHDPLAQGVRGLRDSVEAMQVPEAATAMEDLINASGSFAQAARALVDRCLVEP